MSPANSQDALRYLDPLVLSKLGNMDLIARFAVEGFFAGLHRSPFYGLSVEYSDHRPYIQGDEIRFIDWKAFARSDELHIKRFRQETNVQCHILMDASASMAFGSGPVRKIDYASFLAAALTYLMLRQNDGVGLVVFNNDIRVRIPPKSQKTQLHPILVTLSRLTPQDTTDIPSMLHRLADSTPRRGLMILISDLIHDPDAIAGGLAHLRHLKHDVVVFHVLDDSELNFRFTDMSEFRDPESDLKLRTFPESVREAYLRRVRDFTDRLSRMCGQAEVDYSLLNTSTPLDRALTTYLARRKMLM
jgi:uncharacterized protein (DUF58 family)